MTWITKMAAILGLVLCVAFSSATRWTENSKNIAGSEWQAATHTLPVGVRAEEIKFAGENVMLVGTLLLPKIEGSKRMPGVLIVGGAGPTTRDGVVFGQTAHTQYRELAESLAARGYAVLRYDKRCAGASGCKQHSLFEEYVSDGEAALKFLQKRPEVDPARVVVFGHGEGGFIATVLVRPEQKLVGIVLASAPGRTLGKLIRDHIKKSFTETGKSQAEINAYLARLKRIEDLLLAGRIETLADKPDPSDVVLARLIEQPEFSVSMLINDPLQAIKAVHVPLLILQGEKDVQMNVKDAEYLEEELQRANHPDFTVKVLPDVDYLLQTCKGSATIKALSEPSRPIDPAVFSTLTEWLQKKLGK